MSSSNAGTDSNPYQAPQSLIVDRRVSRGRRVRLLFEAGTLSLLAIAALPLALYSKLYAFAGRAALYVGHWPSYGRPDPKDLPDNFLPATEWLEFAVPLAVFVLQIVAYRWLIARERSDRMRPRRWKRRLALAAGLIPVSWVMIYGLLRADPIGVIEWIMD